MNVHPMRVCDVRQEIQNTLLMHRLAWQQRLVHASLIRRELMRIKLAQHHTLKLGVVLDAVMDTEVNASDLVLQHSSLGFSPTLLALQQSTLH
jgi:hypothetical protein